MDAIYSEYIDLLKSPKEAMQRLCMKFDIYWSESIFNSLDFEDDTISAVNQYISKINKKTYFGKTYDNSLIEMEQQEAWRRSVSDSGEGSVPEEIQQKWGYGFNPEDYAEFESRYAFWTNDENGFPCTTVNEISIVKALVLAEWRVGKEAKGGAGFDRAVKSYNDLLASGSFKPAQQKDNSILSGQTIGELIDLWEENDPVEEEITEPNNYLIKQISIWYYGHMCKTLNIDNPLRDLYEEEMDKYRVKHPEFEESDDEDILKHIIGQAPNDGEDA